MIKRCNKLSLGEKLKRTIVECNMLEDRQISGEKGKMCLFWVN